jgi:hypothetical protein
MTWTRTWTFRNSTVTKTGSCDFLIGIQVFCCADSTLSQSLWALDELIEEDALLDKLVHAVGEGLEGPPGAASRSNVTPRAQHHPQSTPPQATDAFLSPGRPLNAPGTFTFMTPNGLQSFDLGVNVSPAAPKPRSTEPRPPQGVLSMPPPSFPSALRNHTEVNAHLSLEARLEGGYVQRLQPRQLDLPVRLTGPGTPGCPVPSYPGRDSEPSSRTSLGMSGWFCQACKFASPCYPCTRCRNPSAMGIPALPDTHLARAKSDVPRLCQSPSASGGGKFGYQTYGFPGLPAPSALWNVGHGGGIGRIGAVPSPAGHLVTPQRAAGAGLNPDSIGATNGVCSPDAPRSCPYKPVAFLRLWASIGEPGKVLHGEVGVH